MTSACVKLSFLCLHNMSQKWNCCMFFLWFVLMIFFYVTHKYHVCAMFSFVFRDIFRKHFTQPSYFTINRLLLSSKINTYHAEFLKWDNPSYIFGTVLYHFRDINMKTCSWSTNSIEPGQTAQMIRLACLYTVGKSYSLSVLAG